MPIQPTKAAITRDPILVDLALQGGGSHGAFTWGVLDRLLEEPWLGIDGISGTSAGAMNAAVLVDGHAKGGAEGARTALENFWRRVSEAARFSPLRRGPLDVILGRWTLDSSPIYVAMDLMSRLLSPYDLNPMGNNPLRAILAETIDFERLARAPMKLFITATNVRTGRGRVFKNNAVTPDVLLASACLPTMFQAVEIDGEPYWDGGYSGNPTITPLIRECKSRDTILVQINPVERERSPRSASEILNRLNEVSFNAVLLKELRMIALLRQAADPGDREGAQWAGRAMWQLPCLVIPISPKPESFYYIGWPTIGSGEDFASAPTAWPAPVFARRRRWQRQPHEARGQCPYRTDAAGHGRGACVTA
jgi:NTE family protein